MHVVFVHMLDVNIVKGSVAVDWFSEVGHPLTPFSSISPSGVVKLDKPSWSCYFILFTRNERSRRGFSMTRA